MFNSTLTDELYAIFEGIEERGLQFLIPDEYKPLYRIFLRERKLNKLIAQIEDSIDRLNSIEHIILG
jgi:hypothetical protein